MEGQIRWSVGKRMYKALSLLVEYVICGQEIPTKGITPGELWIAMLQAKGRAETTLHLATDADVNLVFRIMTGQWSQWVDAEKAHLTFLARLERIYDKVAEEDQRAKVLEVCKKITGRKSKEELESLATKKLLGF